MKIQLLFQHYLKKIKRSIPSMLKTKSLPVIIPVGLALLYLLGNRTLEHSEKSITVLGHFYAWIPYLIVHSEGNSLALQVDTARIYTNYTKYESKKANTFTIKREGEHLLTVYDSISKQHISFRMDTKLPPLTIKLLCEDSKPYLSGSSINLKKLLAQGRGFRCEILNFDINLTLPVKQFELIFYADNELKQIPSAKDQKSILTEEQKKALSQLKESTVLVFRNIIIKDFYGGEVEAPPFILLLEV